MSTWRIYRKCRRCGQYSNALEAEMANPDSELLDVVRGWHQDCPMVSIHRCADGSYGITDVQGCEKRGPDGNVTASAQESPA